MVSWPCNHCNVDHCICYGGSSEMSQIWVRGSHFSEVNGYCWFWWCFNKKVWLVKHIIIVGLSCKIGNIPVPGTSENQNCQFYEIHHFSLIFTFLYYIVTLKHIRQSYCSDNQHVVAYQWKSMSQGQTEKCTACLARKKYFFCKDKV